MADNVDLMAAECKPFEKIRAFNPQIVVSGTPEKPYYNISYYDLTKKEWCVGYGSYYLSTVYKWLFECFEVVAVNLTEVVRCKDCKHRKMNSCWRVRNQYASWGVANNAPTIQHFCREDFCSYGERRTE